PPTSLHLFSVRGVEARGALKKCILRAGRLWMELLQLHPPETSQDATLDYPQPSRAAQVVRVRKGQLRGRRAATNDGDRDPASRQWSCGVFRLRPTSARLRSLAAAALRVRAAVADRDILRLRLAACGLPNLRRGCRAGSLEQRQEPVDHDVSMVPGPLGQAAGLAGSSYHLPHHLGTCSR